MFRHLAWAVGSYSSGPPAAETVRTESRRGFHQQDVSPCTLDELMVLQYCQGWPNCHPVKQLKNCAAGSRLEKIHQLIDHLVEGTVDVASGGAGKMGWGDAEGALDVVEVAAAHRLGPTKQGFSCVTF